MREAATLSLPPLVGWGGDGLRGPEGEAEGRIVDMTWHGRVGGEGERGIDGGGGVWFIPAPHSSSSSPSPPPPPWGREGVCWILSFSVFLFLFIPQRLYN